MKIKDIEIVQDKATMNQIAFYCSTMSAEREVKAQFGLSTANWVRDTVYAHCVVRGRKCDNIAELQFNYDLGCELEIIRYIEGLHWMSEIVVSRPFLAHVGIHLPDGADWPVTPDWSLVQEAETYRHTAEHLNTGYAAGRLYSYRIYEVSEHTFVKYIKRRHPDGQQK